MILSCALAFGGSLAICLLVYWYIPYAHCAPRDVSETTKSPPNPRRQIPIRGGFFILEHLIYIHIYVYVYCRTIQLYMYVNCRTIRNSPQTRQAVTHTNSLSHTHAHTSAKLWMQDYPQLSTNLANQEQCDLNHHCDVDTSRY